MGFKKSCPSKHRAIVERRVAAQVRQEAALAELAALTHQRQERLAYAAQQWHAGQLTTNKTPEQVAREYGLDRVGGWDRYQRGRLLKPLWPSQEQLVPTLAEREARGLDSVLSAFPGLGKTLVGIELIRQTTLALGQRFGHPTLVVGPKGVYHQWMEEARKFYPTELMTFDSVESSDDAAARFSVARTLQCLDFVVVSYDTLKASVGSPLFQVPWHRIIVDEGTFIVNEDTDVFTACSQINAQRRLFISGTPVPNARAGEMNAILRFLGADFRVPSLAPLAQTMFRQPLDDEEEEEKYAAGAAAAAADTTSWLMDDAEDDSGEVVVDQGSVGGGSPSPDSILAQWRRAIEMYWVAVHVEVLPEAVRKLQTHETETIWVTLSESEREHYRTLWQQANTLPEHRHRLRWVTRLRQACNSVTLTKRTEVKNRVATARREIRDQERAILKDADATDEAKATIRATQRLRRERTKAGLPAWSTDLPPPRQGMVVHAMAAAAPAAEVDEEDDAEEEEEDVNADESLLLAATELPPPVLSSKYRAMLDYERTRMAPGEKALVISETLGPLEEFQHIARAEGLTCEILSGDMTTRQRAEVTARVGNPGSPDPRFVMLPIRLGFGINGLQGTEGEQGLPEERDLREELGLRQGGVSSRRGTTPGRGGGGANHVLFLDGYWNEALEIQGLARLLRPGQMREVFSVKFVTLDTIEELVLRYNRYKKLLHSLVLDVNAHRTL